MNRYSRLYKIQEKQTRVQVVLISIAAIIALGIVLKFGIPALFNLTGTLINISHQKDVTVADKSLEILSPPTLTSQYSATPSAVVNLSGTADPNKAILLFRNSFLLDNTSSNDKGDFKFQADLVSGRNDFTVQQSDSKSQKSDLSEVVTVYSLNKQPKLDISAPNDGAQFTNQDSVQVIGQTDPGVSITINDSSAIVNSDGKFQYFFRLSSGDNHLKIDAIDQAGNKTEKEITVKSS